MGILNLFSRRQRTARGEVPDVYVYDVIPVPLRVQIVHIFKDCLGNEGEYFGFNTKVKEAYEYIVDSLCREYGVFRLPGTESYEDRHSMKELFTFILNEKDVERVLDAVELGLAVADSTGREWSYRRRNDSDSVVDSSLAELNLRFQQHGVGYRFESGRIVRIDSEFVHAEVVKPVLSLLHKNSFKGAEAEFLKAFEHQRHARTKEALSECAKAIESTLKAIADRRKWKRESNATMKPLLDLAFTHGLIPAFWASHFAGLRAMLESGVPTARNKLGGHGQGVEVMEVPQHFSAFAIHQTAAAILFLCASDAEK